MVDPVKAPFPEYFDPTPYPDGSLALACKRCPARFGLKKGGEEKPGVLLVLLNHAKSHEEPVEVPRKCPKCRHLWKHHGKLFGCKANYSAGPSGTFRCNCVEPVPAQKAARS